MTTSINQFRKSFIRLKEALQQEKNEFIQDSVIRRFSFCIDLSLKAGKKVMGSSTSSPKNVIRELAQDGYIDDAILWLQAKDQRNLSTHTYNEKLAEEVYTFIQTEILTIAFCRFLHQKNLVYSCAQKRQSNFRTPQDTLSSLAFVTKN